MEPLTLRTERLILRPFAERDTDAVAAACDDPDTLRWLPLPEPYERKHALEFVTRTNPAGWAEDTMYNFGAFTHAGDLVGSIGLVRIAQLRTAERQAELGFWTAPGQRRRGYTVEAGRAVVDWAFAGLGVERLEWVAQVGNEGSLAVARRLGFVLEGVQRARIVHRGTRRDAWIAALLPSDWGRALETPYLPSTARA
ncbi:GNAT family N-acetyltransferase [Streptomyces boncukensis]|uniref:GNAT family N-acetyltransferase n=1 Tax=Streptomyces boncukensis TaxID=2711219 RepID=A0A6G4WUP0_9ACTN|nr:GNAT family protein [Streptomyces boncukensis]NGO68996.1 GNAT family N-acetyltransferase [Streptomyces boncukensis]